MSHAVTSEYDDIARLWGTSLRGTEGKPDTTVTAYLKSLHRLSRWAAATECPRGPEQVTAEDMDAFFVARRAQTYRGKVASPTTIAMDFRHLRVLFNFLVSRGVRDDSPMAPLKAPTVPDQPPPVFSDDALRAFLAACAGKTFADRRDAAIIRLLFDTGCRHNEIATLDLTDLDRVNQLVTVTGKGGRRRNVPYGHRTAEAIELYLLTRKKHPHAHLNALWLAQPVSGHAGALGYDGIRLLLLRRGRMAGVTGALNPHRFRHTAAHRQKRGGMSDDELMELFGWLNPNMPRRYGKSVAHERAVEKSRIISHADDF